MATTIYDKVTFDLKNVNDLNPSERRELELLVLKLKPLEQEIINDPKGSITISNTGNIFTISFEDSLGDKISKIITGR